LVEDFQEPSLIRAGSVAEPFFKIKSNAMNSRWVYYFSATSGVNNASFEDIASLSANDETTKKFHWIIQPVALPKRKKIAIGAAILNFSQPRNCPNVRKMIGHSRT
jgi:hypothetical protein